MLHSHRLVLSLCLRLMCLFRVFRGGSGDAAEYFVIAPSALLDSFLLLLPLRQINCPMGNVKLIVGLKQEERITEDFLGAF